MMYTIDVNADLTYEVDPEELRIKFPIEWAEFVERSYDEGTEPTDKGWIAECFGQNPDLFHLVDRIDEIERIEPKMVVSSKVVL